MEAAALAGEFIPGLGRAEEAPVSAPIEPVQKRGRGRPRNDGSPAKAQTGIPGYLQRKKERADAGQSAPPVQKEPKPARGLPWFAEGEVLSEREAEKLYEPLKTALGDYLDYTDEYIWYRTQDATKEPVWSNADDDELSALARLLIKRGKRSAGAATVVRAIVNGDDYVTAAVFMLPRMVETQRRLRAAPKREKRKRA